MEALAARVALPPGSGTPPAALPPK